MSNDEHSRLLNELLGRPAEYYLFDRVGEDGKHQLQHNTIRNAIMNSVSGLDDVMLVRPGDFYRANLLKDAVSMLESEEFDATIPENKEKMYRAIVYLEELVSTARSMIAMNKKNAVGGPIMGSSSTPESLMTTADAVDLGLNNVIIPVYEGMLAISKACGYKGDTVAIKQEPEEVEESKYRVDPLPKPQRRDPHNPDRTGHSI